LDDRLSFLISLDSSTYLQKKARQERLSNRTPTGYDVGVYERAY